jgi:hypothetical protein
MPDRAGRLMRPAQVGLPTSSPGSDLYGIREQALLQANWSRPASFAAR